MISSELIGLIKTCLHKTPLKSA